MAMAGMRTNTSIYLYVQGRWPWLVNKDKYKCLPACKVDGHGWYEDKYKYLPVCKKDGHGWYEEADAGRAARQADVHLHTECLQGIQTQGFIIAIIY